MAVKEWIVKKNDCTDKSLIKRLLFSRGIKTDEDINEFLNPLEVKLTHPKVFLDMEKAVERISSAISNNENGISYYISTLDVENNAIIGGSKLFDSDQTRYSETHALLPVVTISRNIQIISGEGKSDNPYKLEQ